MSDLNAVKAEARKAAKLTRKTAKAAAPDAAMRAKEHFLSSIEFGPDDIVSGYRPIFSELDPSPLLEALHARGIRLCVPVIDGPARPLRFALWTPHTPMIEGAFGAEIPAQLERVEPTIIIAPMLSFDRHGYRLGYGGGFYDRTLEKLRALRPTRAYGYAYAAQEVPEVPIEPTDQRLDGVVTEAGLMSGQ